MVPREGNAIWFVVSSGSIYFVCLMESCVIYARSHRTIIDSWFLHCFEDTKANYSTMPSDLKNQSYRQLGFSGCLIWSLAWYVVLCVFLWVWNYWDREKSEKRKKSAAILRNCFFPVFCSACSATYSNDRVLLPVTPSALLLSLSVSLGFNEY